MRALHECLEWSECYGHRRAKQTCIRGANRWKCRLKCLAPARFRKAPICCELVVTRDSHAPEDSATSTRPAAARALQRCVVEVILKPRRWIRSSAFARAQNQVRRGL